MTERELFEAALELPPGERAAFLDGACGGDAPLRQRLEALLSKHDQAGSFLERPAVTGGLPADPAPTGAGPQVESAGQVLEGRYKLLEAVGEGGMGTVWMAQQTEPVKRLVAVKLIKAGLGSKAVLARFEAERQALALMDHPNIARVLDAGAAPDGRPFFVMELVKGVPLTRYCDEHRLTPKQRLELFVPVCHAVQHAHQKGIIHRDLKPSNVLVAQYDDRPVPKVIDFGVAKATGQQLTEQTLHTGFGAVVGTVEYMSPEQASFNQLDVDTRSDVYSLGVVLYELLTGSPPFSRKELEKAGVLEMLRVIREKEPSKPSTKLSTAEGLPALAANRGTEPRRLTALVRGELDWIVMRALEKDRNRRYDTANAFAADVERYLADEPVQACPPSAGYRLRKFIRRNRGRLTAAAVLSVALLAAVGTAAGSIGWAARDREARQAAVDQEASLALKESERLGEQRKWPESLSAAKRAEAVLAGGESAALRGRIRAWRRDVEMVLRLEDARLQGLAINDGKFFHKDLIDAAYRKAFRDYGIDVEEPPTERAAEAIRARPIRAELIAAVDEWAWYAPSKELSAQLLAVARAADTDAWSNRVRDAVWDRPRNQSRLATLAGSDQARTLPPSTLDHLCIALSHTGLTDAAVALLRDAQRRRPEDFGLNFGLAYVLFEKRPTPWDEVVRFSTAASVLRPDNGFLRAVLGDALHEQGKLEEAIACYKKAIELDPKHAWHHNNLSNTLREQGKLDESIVECRKAIELDPQFAWPHYNLGLALWRQGDLDQAIAEFRKTLALDPKHAGAHLGIGNVLYQQGKFDEAIAECRKAVALSPQDAVVHCGLGYALDGKGRLDDAIAEYKEALRLKPDFPQAHNNLANVLSRKGRLDEAIAESRKAIELDPQFAAPHNNLGTDLYAKGRLNEAIAEFRKAIALDRRLAPAYTSLGAALYKQGKPEEAIPYLRKALELNGNDAGARNFLRGALARVGRLDEVLALDREAVERDPNNPWKLTSLGESLQRAGKGEEAIGCYRKAIAVYPKYARAHCQLGDALRDKGQLNEAAACYRKAIELDPKCASAHTDLALVIVTYPDRKLGNAAEAVQLARKAVELAPSKSGYWNVLGAAHYRARGWKEAVTALEKSMALSNGGDGSGWFFLAMAHWQLGEKEKARRWFDRAAQWMDKNEPKDEGLRRFRAEATELLKVEPKKR